MLVAVYMIVIVALCLVVYFTLPETGNRGDRATVALADPEVLEGEHLVSSTSSTTDGAKRSH
jgi:MHS family alpha-ketoglutarate permease-like MFS transporter